jgi:hypothetical protein
VVVYPFRLLIQPQIAITGLNAHSDKCRVAPRHGAGCRAPSYPQRPKKNSPGHAVLWGATEAGALRGGIAQPG